MHQLDDFGTCGQPLALKNWTSSGRFFNLHIFSPGFQFDRNRLCGDFFIRGMVENLRSKA